MDKDGVWSRMWFDYGGFEVAYDDPRPQMLDVDSWTRIEYSQLREADLLEDVRDLDLDPVGAAPTGSGKSVEPSGPARGSGLDHARSGQATHPWRAHGRDPGQQRDGLVRSGKGTWISAMSSCP